MFVCVKIQGRQDGLTNNNKNKCSKYCIYKSFLNDIWYEGIRRLSKAIYSNF